MKLRAALPYLPAGVLLLAARLAPLPQKGNLAGIPTFCPLKILTGIPCPGCGMTRSLVCCAHGEWTQAANFHPLGPILFGILWLALAAGVLGLWRKPPVISSRLSFFGGSTFGVALLILWIVRLSGILPFPAHF